MIALDYQGFMPNYMIWTMHGKVSVNVLQENDDDVDMPDVAIHDADEVQQEMKKYTIKI